MNEYSAVDPPIWDRSTAGLLGISLNSGGSTAKFRRSAQIILVERLYFRTIQELLGQKEVKTMMMLDLRPQSRRQRRAQPTGCLIERVVEFP